MNAVQHAIGSGGNERKRASHVINKLEKINADEFKECLVARGYITNSIKKMEASEMLSMMDEANANQTQLRFENMHDVFYFKSN